MYGQIGATTGLRKRPSYTDIIDAQTPYLPGRVQAKKDKEFADKTFDFNVQQAQWQKDQAEKQNQLDWQAGHDARKQQNRANNLGYMNLGVNVLGQSGALSDLYSMIMGL